MPVQACKTPAYVASGHRYPFTAGDDKEREAAKKKAAKYGTPKRVTLSGYSWGDGKCYDFAPNDEGARKRAFAKAAKQGRAIKRSQSMRGSMDENTLRKIFGGGS